LASFLIIVWRTLHCSLSSFKSACCKSTDGEVYIYLAQVARRILAICVLCTDEVKQAPIVRRHRSVGVVNSFSSKHRLYLRGNKDRSAKGRHVARIITQSSKFIPTVGVVKMTSPWALIHTLKARRNTPPPPPLHPTVPSRTKGPSSFSALLLHLFLHRGVLILVILVEDTPKHAGPQAKGSNPTVGLTLLWVRNPFRGNFNHWQLSRNYWNKRETGYNM